MLVDYFDNTLQKMGYSVTASLMSELEDRSLASHKVLSTGATVLDFGAGVGGSSIYFRELGARVVSIDLRASALRCLGSRAATAGSICFTGDGLALMRGTAEETYDLVIAMMFGPTSSESFVQEFLTESNRIIKNSGRVVVFGECHTMSLFSRLPFGIKIVHPGKIGGEAFVLRKSTEALRFPVCNYEKHIEPLEFFDWGVSKLEFLFWLQRTTPRIEYPK